ncbi:MAG: YheU family protein [Pseudomonadales bacterium]|nr:YheU family protein [Pseudomonadales bacterium]MCP5183140.1 YheU family protein [Pseudomonadales bacterium]
MRIDPAQLSADALLGVVDNYILREGTDYGREYTLAQKREHVLAALRSGRAIIDFDPVSGSVNLLTVEGGSSAK